MVPLANDDDGDLRINPQIATSLCKTIVIRIEECYKKFEYTL